MSIASQLTALEGNISDAYNMVAQRGGTVPARKNMENLDDAIATIPSGGGASYDIKRQITANGEYSQPTTPFNFVLPSNVVKINDYALDYAFYGSTGLSTVNISGVTSLGMYAMNQSFYGCTGLTSVDMSGLTTVDKMMSCNQMCRGCTSLTSVDLGSLSTVSGSQAFYNAFYSCRNLTTVDLSSLSSVTGSLAFNNAFGRCTSLTAITFSALATITGSSSFGSAFTSCTSLQSVSFPALTESGFGSATNYFSGLLAGCSNVTLHFKDGLQTKLATMSGYPNFSGTNTTVLFDL